MTHDLHVPHTQGGHVSHEEGGDGSHDEGGDGSHDGWDIIWLWYHKIMMM